MTQLALSEPETVDLTQVFLLFLTDTKGRTLYQKMGEGKFLLGDGHEQCVYN